VGPYAEIGENCVLMNGATVLAKAVIGPRTRLHAHAVIGDDPQFLGFDPKTDSRVCVGSDCEIREHATVHRGLKDGAETVVGNHVMIMNSGHVGHDCHIADHVVIAACTLVAGHVEVAERAFISGLVVIHQHCRIGKMAMLGGQCGVGQDVPPFMTVQGGSGLGHLAGLNTVGLRRGGVSVESRMALKAAFRILYRSQSSLKTGIARVRSTWEDRPIPDELQQLLDFVSIPSKRGHMGGFNARLSQLAGDAGSGEPDA